MTAYEKARAFIYRSARPIDLAVYKFRFENGSKEDIITALSAYQNSDGGFGLGLEPDNFNPDSLPMGVWKATEYIKEAGGLEPDHPIIKGILRYLESGDGYDDTHSQWANTVPSNNDCPCAVWWKHPESGSTFEYNPTAALAGFIVKYAPPQSELYQKGAKIAKEAAGWFITSAPIEQHIARCFISLYDYCKDAGVSLFDEKALADKLYEIVDKSICRDNARWWEYLPRPSTFIDSRESRFYSAELEPLCKQECEFIKANQHSDGSFYIPWTWGNDYKEWTLAESWGKAAVAIDNLRFLREFDPDFTI